MDPINPQLTTSTNSAVVPVGKGTRFINALVDGILLGIVTNIISYTVLRDMDSGAGLSFLISLVMQFFYYYMQEKNNGLTIGKRLTGTKVVMADGSPVTDEAARTRSLWRLIPLLDALSFLFSDLGWHDKYSNTRVVSAK
ncbi:RDD family protein [Hymenobacter endophyticus]|uniref:RDD family protein n=1 Tax=Hymenobacter endophyticus TaxID=3076335 RepID=A0ABU3TIE7_9BACT|nr:RDD family protein [Hymenobacter endophyticus]MDU0371141.1 RDD family protein [Hymenobacter endophyticus]